MSDHRIWNRETQWPADPVGHVFLARAVQRIGNAMFGGEWLGSETSLRPAAVSKPTLGHLDLVIIPRRATPSRLEPPDPNIVTPIKDKEAALRRLRSVYVTVVEACQSGVLVTAARARAGGRMTQLSRTVWNTDRWLSRFDTCEIDVEAPFEHPWKGEGSWIFVTEKSLDKFLFSLPHHQPTENNLPHLSPYLRTMITVAAKVEISPDNQPKKESLVADICAAWKGPGALTNHLAQAMATLLREPASQSGRRPPTTPKRKKG